MLFLLQENLTGIRLDPLHVPDHPLAYEDGRNRSRVLCSELCAHVFELVHSHRRSSERQGTERLHTSFGPAEYTDEYTTPHGKFTTHTTLEPEMFAGTDVTADNPALMGRVVRLLRESAAFTEDIDRSE